MRNVSNESDRAGLLAMFAEALGGHANGQIERQEKRGQVSLVNSDTLPKDMMGCSRVQFEAMGIEFLKDADDLFVYCRLPQGWRKVPTDHSMWSDLVDERGRKRASIFYKAAFYDRSAHISLNRRFKISVEPVGGYSQPDYGAKPWHCVVTDGNTVIYQSPEQVEAEPSYSATNRQPWLDWANRRDALAQQGKVWLFQNFPKWEDPTAYWE